MAGICYAGTDGKISANGTVLNMEAWDVDTSAGDIKKTNFESLGYGEHIAGVREGKVHIKGFWDGIENPHANPPDLRAGEIILNTLLYVSRTSNIFWNFPQLVILTVKVSDEVEARVDFEFEAISSGIFYYPGAIAG